jgi:hypothetical protein
VRPCRLYSPGTLTRHAADGDKHPVPSHNGAEDARDHLWLAQDLWTQDAVWN